MSRKEWNANHDGHAIKVVLTWILILRLYIDNELIDECYAKGMLGFSSTTLLNSFIASIGGKNSLVEIIAKPTFFSIAVKICVDGKKVGGDEF